MLAIINAFIRERQANDVARMLNHDDMLVRYRG